MRKLLFFMSLILFSCTDSNDGLVCTEEFRMLTVTVNYSNQEPVLLTDYYTQKISTGEKIYFKPENEYIDSIYTNNGTYILFTDDKLGKVSRSGNEFQFKGFIDTIMVVNKTFIIRNDGCHIDLISGNTNIIYGY